MSAQNEWHHCEKFAGDAGHVDIVQRGKVWRMEDTEYTYGAVFQHGATLEIAYCPFCGVMLGEEPEQLIGLDGQTYTVAGAWKIGRIGEE